MNRNNLTFIKLEYASIGGRIVKENIPMLIGEELNKNFLLILRVFETEKKI